MRCDGVPPGMLELTAEQKAMSLGLPQVHTKPASLLQAQSHPAPMQPQTLSGRYSHQCRALPPAAVGSGGSHDALSPASWVNGVVLGSSES